jgi:hypothetical protein
MSLSFDGLIPHDHPRGSGGFCRIRVFSAPDRPTVVIASDLPGNPGKSVTYAAEGLARDVCQRLRIDPERLRWVEHYAAAQPAGYAWVDFGRPSGGRFVDYWWQPTTQARVEAVIGRQLDA